VLHYSGHGGSVKDEDGDEEDGYDETLVPVDYKSSGHIVDDDIHDILCKGLPRGVRLTAIVDCCHSATVLDLPFTYNVNGDLEIIENDRNEGISKLVAAGARFALDGNKKAAVSNVTVGMKLLMSGGSGGGSSSRARSAREKTVRTKSTHADVICFSGCKDKQTSADATIDGKATGAMSYALIQCLSRDHGKITYTNLLRQMRRTLSGKYSQVPMLSAGRKLVLDEPFGI